MPHTEVHPYTNRLCGLKRKQSSDPKDWVGTMQIKQYVYVTGKGFRMNTGITRMTFNIGFIRLAEPWREPPE